ncbi:helix-turn-helix domain-containing protein [Arthrobacter sulfonylureivorans]|uniref:helix-turn-helix domain-containing protein n=1 Tax=Arthrobacter sulfonylureivorans TaxID=2486855 RepID=UPI0039E28073
MRRVDRDAIAELAEDGYTAPQIAERLGCAVRTVNRARAELGLAQPGPNQARGPVPAEKLARARALIEDGASHKEVLQTLGMGWQTLSKYFPGTGWTNVQKGQHAARVRQLNRL